MKLSSCHPSGASNFEATPNFFKSFSIPDFIHTKFQKLALFLYLSKWFICNMMIVYHLKKERQPSPDGVFTKFTMDNGHCKTIHVVGT